MINKLFKDNTLVMMALILLLLSVAGATYAYFRAQIQSTVTRGATVRTSTIDTLTFQISDDISFGVTQSNFTENGNNISGSTTATAILTPNNETGQASGNYYLYLNMTSNPTVYSAGNTSHNPELLLQVFDGSNQLVTLTGLGTQKTIKGLTGYDITGVTGIKTLLNNHAIVANGSSQTETWRVVITMINLDLDQLDNTGKTITGFLIMRESEMVYCDFYPNDNMCNLSLGYNPEYNITPLTNGYLYHHDSSLVNGANDGSYRFSGTNPNNYICFGSDATTCPDANIYRIMGLIPVDVVTDGTTTPVTTETQMLYKIIKHDYVTSTEVSTGTSSYVGGKVSTYNGASGNQYVNDPQGYYWSGSSSNHSNTWSSSTLNTAGLNGSYLTSLGSTWTDKIATVMWKVGGGDASYIRTATPMSTVYTNEITDSGQHVTNAPTDGKNEYAAKVGLMYVSDYGYAAPQSAWSTELSSYNSSTIEANNWLYRGITEWTVSRIADNTDTAYFVTYTGYVNDVFVYNRAYGMRPVLFLNSSTSIDMSTHDGTISDPYRIVN